MSKRTSGLLAVLLSVVFWGISFVSTKVVLKDLPPVSIAFFRQITAILPLLAIMRFKKETIKLEKGEGIRFVVASLFGIVLYFVLENQGLTMTSASNASMLVAAIPVFALIAESAATKKRLSLPSLFCILASIAGVYCVIFNGGPVDLSSRSFLGNLMVLGAMASWIVYTFLSKKLGERYSSIKMTTIQCFISIPLFVPFLLHEIGSWRMPSLQGLWNLLFLGVFCSALAYVFYLQGLKVLGPVLPSAFLNLIPVVTITTGVLFLNETLSLVQLAGSVLIVGSLSFLSLMKKPVNAQTQPLSSINKVMAKAISNQEENP